jgi:hypothetical protein
MRSWRVSPVDLKVMFYRTNVGIFQLICEGRQLETFSPIDVGGLDFRPYVREKL